MKKREFDPGRRNFLIGVGASLGALALAEAIRSWVDRQDVLTHREATADNLMQLLGITTSTPYPELVARLYQLTFKESGWMQNSEVNDFINDKGKRIYLSTDERGEPVPVAEIDLNKYKFPDIAPVQRTVSPHAKKLASFSWPTEAQETLTSS